MQEKQRNLLHKKWYDFDDYKENDYREVFNHEALYLDDIYRNGVHFKDIQFDDTIKELNYNTYEVIGKIIDDIEEVGLDKNHFVNFASSLLDVLNSFITGKSLTDKKEIEIAKALKENNK